MTTSSSSGDVGPLPEPTVEPSGAQQVQETFEQQQTILEELRSQEQAVMAALLKINMTNLPAMERAWNIFLTHMTAVEKTERTSHFGQEDLPLCRRSRLTLCCRTKISGNRETTFCTNGKCNQC
jgi:hypothetical protein